MVENKIWGLLEKSGYSWEIWGKSGVYLGVLLEIWENLGISVVNKIVFCGQQNCPKLALGHKDHQKFRGWEGVRME